MSILKLLLSLNIIFCSINYSHCVPQQNCSSISFRETVFSVGQQLSDLKQKFALRLNFESSTKKKRRYFSLLENAGKEYESVTLYITADSTDKKIKDCELIYVFDASTEDSHILKVLRQELSSVMCDGTTTANIDKLVLIKRDTFKSASILIR